jgi:type II secretory pathway pseudopilin PulG/ribosomal protein L32
MKTCPNCGQPALDSHRFCMRCGADISAAPVINNQAQYAQTQAAPNPYAPQQQYYAPAPAKSSNTALIVIVVAVAAVVLIPVVLIIAAIAIPNLLRARVVANESSAVSSVRTINTAATAYMAQFNHYPEGLASMGSPVAGVSPEYGAGLIDNTLASGKQHGYVFTYRGIDTKHDGTFDDYEVTACPEQRNSTGVKCFFSDSSSVVRFSSSGPADKESPPLE